MHGMKYLPLMTVEMTEDSAWDCRLVFGIQYDGEHRMYSIGIDADQGPLASLMDVSLGREMVGDSRESTAV